MSLSALILAAAVSANARPPEPAPPITSDDDRRREARLCLARRKQLPGQLYYDCVYGRYAWVWHDPQPTAQCAQSGKSPTDPGYTLCINGGYVKEWRFSNLCIDEIRAAGYDFPKEKPPRLIPPCADFYGAP